MEINAFGKPCPQPLVMAKKQIDGGNKDFSITVDNETAVKNLTRLGIKTGTGTAVTTIDGGYRITFAKDGEASAADQAQTLKELDIDTSSATGSGYAVFIGKDQVGQGDDALGRNLMKMALYTLSESEQIPVSLLFMNSGVTLVANDEPQVIESVATLSEKGTEVLVCGTCLDYFNLKDDLKIGEVSNMYDIMERMQEASKVITL